jgi:hypothetical protein
MKTFLILIFLIPSLSFAHGPVDRVSEAQDVETRVFIADEVTGNLSSLDLPSGKISSVLSTPKHVMSMSISQDSKHLFVMRGRDTFRDMVSIINTGFDKEKEEVLPPYLARTIPAPSPGPGNVTGTMLSVDGKDALFIEDKAELIVFLKNDFTGLQEVATRVYKLASPDHYSYLETDEFLYVGHLRRGFIQVINKDTGLEETQIPGCPVVHGKVKDKVTGRLFFACMTDILVIGTKGEETNKVVGRIPYPNKQRVGAFFKAKNGIIWAYTEGVLPMIYRLDFNNLTYNLETINISPSMRQYVSKEMNMLLSLTRSGWLALHDANTGSLIKKIKVSTPFIGEYHEHVGKAILPDIKTVGDQAFISITHEGKVVQVDLKEQVKVKTFDVGGKPTRLMAIGIK